MVNPRRALVLCMSFFLLAPAALAPAHAEVQAQDNQAARACRQPQDKDTMDDIVQNCSAAISSGSLSGRELAAVYAERGFALTVKRGLTDAESDLDEAVKIDPEFAVAYSNRANFWNVSHKFDRAIADAEQAVRLDPNLPAGYFVRGAAESNLGQYDRAIADYQQALALNHNFKPAAEMLEQAKAKL